jgi:hypothetical protein
MKQSAEGEIPGAVIRQGYPKLGQSWKKTTFDFFARRGMRDVSPQS